MSRERLKTELHSRTDSDYYFPSFLRYAGGHLTFYCGLQRSFRSYIFVLSTERSTLPIWSTFPKDAPGFSVRRLSFAVLLRNYNKATKNILWQPTEFILHGSPLFVMFYFAGRQLRWPLIVERFDPGALCASALSLYREWLRWGIILCCKGSLLQLDRNPKLVSIYRIFLQLVVLRLSETIFYFLILNPKHSNIFFAIGWVMTNKLFESERTAQFFY